MLLVVDSTVLDEQLRKLRGLQEWMVEWGDPGAARTMNEIVNSLNHNAVGIEQSIVRGAKQIREER